MMILVQEIILCFEQNKDKKYLKYTLDKNKKLYLTKTAHYPRCELRYLCNPDTQKQNWWILPPNSKYTSSKN